MYHNSNLNRGLTSKSFFSTMSFSQKVLLTQCRLPLGFVPVHLLQFNVFTIIFFFTSALLSISRSRSSSAFLFSSSYRWPTFVSNRHLSSNLPSPNPTLTSLIPLRSSRNYCSSLKTLVSARSLALPLSSRTAAIRWVRRCLSSILTASTAKPGTDSAAARSSGPGTSASSKLAACTLCLRLRLV